MVFMLADEEVCRLRPTGIKHLEKQNKKEFFAMDNFSFRPLFEKISVKTTLALLQAIILEK